ncbi:Antirestriction [uncultured Caudovirales phage]|uniref:Antirestriction n=1 Tax=uncultured Caudovirales phage TaxID=2100421 RepID=A0A6J5L3R5_9CAUD|nr:Antirestriction [uncultured Caudovirales phage]CAB5216901.1 Antirestriction [uncultured Caudovirales phage]
MTILNGNFNPSYNEYGVYIANLEQYSAGVSHGTWLALPATDEEIETAMDAVFFGKNRDHDYAIHDYQAPFRISEYSNIESLNEQFERLDAVMNRSCLSKSALADLLNEFDDIEKTIEALENYDIRVFENCNSIEDAVYEYETECGTFDHIPNSVMSYFDWERYSRDFELELNGQFIESENCVIMIQY